MPSTPASVFHLLDCYLAETGRDPSEVYARSDIVVVGRSNNVGKPAVLLGAARNATVVSCDVHSYRSGLLYPRTRRADVLVVAAGVPGLVTGAHVKAGASVAEQAAGISPVPGGVGPITDVWLLHNTVAAARLAAGVADAQRAVDAGPLTRAWGDTGVAAATGPRAAR